MAQRSHTAHRPMPRIVPAIPHRLARTPRKRPVPAQIPSPCYPHSHPHQLSAGALEFRTANDSPPPQTQECAPAPAPASAPAPSPTQTEVEVQAQPHTHTSVSAPAHVHAYASAHSLPPPPGFAPPQYTPFVPGHVHHPSDVGAPWLSPPPADGAFASPSHACFADHNLGSDHGDDQHALAYPTATAPAGPHVNEAAFELAAYLSTHVGNPDLADFVLQIRSAEATLFSMPVHGIIVVRSPVIAEAARYSPAPTHRARDTRRLLDVLVSDCFITRESLQEAVNVLYGAPLLSTQNFLFGLAPYRHDSDAAEPSRDARRRMHQILSYMAAASALQMPSMLARGVDIARLLVRWDTVDLVLRYALQVNPVARARALVPDAEDPFVAALLTSAIEFMAYTIPAGFQFYTRAPELRDIPRLPDFVDSPPTSHNPRLSNICFGEAPPKNGLQPRHAASVLSSTLVSLPLPLVDRLLNHRATASQLGWTGAVELMQDVVHERESRRQKALQAQPKSAHSVPLSTALLDNLHTQESVEKVDPSPLHPSGHKLVAKTLPAED